MDHNHLKNKTPGESTGSADPYFVGIVIASTLFFGYALLRARQLSITHDEALTYLLHVRNTSFRDVFLHLKALSSNNHLLNTLGIKLIIPYLGNSELVLRIPALLGYVLYLFGGYRILRLFLKKQYLFIGFVLLQTNPFLMDFFSLARGYSLGMGFSLWSVYYLFNRLQLNETSDIVKNNLLALATLTLSVLSNLTFLNMYVAVTGILLLVELKSTLSTGRARAAASAKMFIKTFLLPFMTSGGVLAVIYQPAVLRQIMPHIADWGGTRGFWQDTVASLLKASLYGQAYSSRTVVNFAKLAIAGICIIAIAVCLRSLFRKDKRLPVDMYLITVSAMLVIIGLSAKAQYLLLGQRYALERGAIFLIPLFTILLLLLWRHVSDIKQQYLRIATQSVFLGVFLLLSIHAFSCLNLTHCHNWRYDAFSKKTAETIFELRRSATDSKRKSRIGIEKGRRCADSGSKNWI